MEMLEKMLETLNNLCYILATLEKGNFTVVDWAFGFIVYKDGEKVCDGNFAMVLDYLTKQL